MNIKDLKGIPKGLIYALKEAENSSYQQRLGAVIMQGSLVLSRGYNQVRYKAIGVSRYTNFKESLHAERSVISQINIKEIKNATLYIARLMKNGDSGLAAPCDCCLHMIVDITKKYGTIKKIIFTIPEAPFYEEIKVKDLI